MFDIKKCAIIKAEGISMQKYLPSKIFIAVAASALFIVGGGYLVFFVVGSRQQVVREEKNERQLAIQSNEAALFAAKDTDGDGLKDWEEVLWHTDPNNPDTDGDGIKDNDEILAKRDPTKAGPNDTIDALALAQKMYPAKAGSIGKEKQGEQSSTLTEQLARDFSDAYVRRKFSGSGTIDQNYLSKLLFSGVTKGIGKENLQLPDEIFTKKDFVIVADSSSAAIRDYLNRLGELFVSIPNNGDPALSAQNELQFTIRAIEEERLDDLKKLLVARDAYKKFANGLKAMPVPASMAKSHQSMANSFWRLSLIVEQMSEFEKDPAASFAALNAYLVEARRSIGPLTAIVEQIKTNHFVFQEDEGGALFNRYASLPLP